MLDVRFDILTEFNIKIAVFWNVLQCDVGPRLDKNLPLPNVHT